MQTKTVGNPFGEMDVPDPRGPEVVAFAASATLVGDTQDANAPRWADARIEAAHGIDGAWTSRWNGGADPAVPDDTPDKWKTGCAEARSIGDRVFIRFDWHGGARRGLIESERQGADRLVGKYINLTNPAVTRPWVGLIVDETRIDGCWTNGRLDFRR